VLVEESNHYIKSDAILRIASRLAVPFPLVAAALLPMPHFVRDTFYDQVCPTSNTVMQLMTVLAPTVLGNRLHIRFQRGVWQR
jgi:hypothetical protein